MSHYLRCLVLARHLCNHFEILFAHSEKYAGFISAEGFKTFSCKQPDAEHVMDCAKKFNFSWINEKAIESVYLDQVKVIRKLRPTAVLGDTSLTLKMAAEKTAVTFISLMNGYMSKYYVHTRNLSITHPVYKYVSILSGQLLDLVTQKGERLTFYRLHRPFKKIRSAYGLSRKITYPDELEGDINLVCDINLLFPQKSLPSNYTMIAPLYYDTGTEYSRVSEQLDKTKKTIFVTMGSTGDWQKMNFLNNPYFKKYNIVTAGDSCNVLDAPNVIKASFISMREIFPFTDLVICQGGNGTIYQALLYGIPLLCKTNNFEQEWNLAALERLQLGRSLDDVEMMNEYISLIADWIPRKNTEPFLFAKLQVKNEVAGLASVIEQIVEKLLQVCVGSPAF